MIDPRVHGIQVARSRDRREKYPVQSAGPADVGLRSAALAEARPAIFPLRALTLILVLALALACATPVAAKGISQTISFAPLAGQIYGASPFTVSATASSGLPVTYASTTKATCAVNGNEVTLAAAGNCTIQATQSGNESYAAAPKVSQSFAIAKADQTITFAALPDMPLAAASFVLAATASSDRKSVV